MKQNRKGFIVTVLSVLLALTLTQTVFAAGAKEEKKSPPRTLVMATGGTTSTGYILGGTIADLLTRKIDNTTVTVQATGGSIENLRLLLSGEADIAHSTEMVNSYNGTGSYAKSGAVKNAVPLMLYGIWAVHIVVKADSPVQKVEDLRGLRIGMGAAGSGNMLTVEAVLNGHGITLNDVKPDYISVTEQIDALRDGNIDVSMFDAVAPSNIITQMAAQQKIRLISITPENAQKIMSGGRPFSPVTIPKGTYKDIDVDIPTVNSPGWLMVRTDMPEDLAYNIVKTVSENLDALGNVNVEFKMLTREQMPITFGVPLHPGAAKYFKEAGLLK